uniref:Oligo alginate lyase n=1 Tax=Siphoviridae sp. ctR5S1 TaxID=2825498 RepID=A0A8S5Q1J8_9CAUD|nr:MAG TPA: Oligo alginate lyase [Siphoviridae sp. ctR5S1]
MKKILLKFDPLPASMQFKRIVSMVPYVYALSISDGSAKTFNAIINQTSFNENEVTYGNWPSSYRSDLFGMPPTLAQPPIWVGLSTWTGQSKRDIASAIQNGICIGYGGDEATIQTTGANRPYLLVTIDESATADILSITSMSPNAGTIDKTSAAVFTWGIKAPYECVPPLVQSSAVYLWRASESGTATEINVTGDTQSVTIPANTFTGLSMQWRVAVTANSGKVSVSEWVTLSTADAESTAAIKSPKGEIVDASRPVAFAWTHIISTGTAQTKAELQISTDMQTWTALATVTGAEMTYTAPANTLGSGTKYWRVRTYNTDNAAGAWSDAAEFICVGAPAAPAVSIKSQSPRPVIGWQSSEQLAYQLEIDGVYSSGTYYGTEKTWTAPMYLEDGEYIVRVRVQNEYAMWSPWGSAALQVANTAGPAINLMAEAGDTVRLSWSAAGGYHYNFYLIYRDGKLIAKTTEHTYTDLRSIGRVSYQVRGCFAASSNYRLSNTVTVTASVPCVTLIDLDSGDVLPLPYSASTHRTTGRNLSRGVQSVQLAGRRYPTIERSMHYAETISVACAFREAEDCAALEALVGKMVTVKTPEGKMVSGCLSVLAATADGGFYTTYQFDVEQADVEEVVDIDS